MLDERTRHIRRLRRARGSARRWMVLAGGLAGTTAVLLPYQGVGALDAVWAGLAGASVVLAGWRWRDARALAAEPMPDPPPPAVAGERWLSLLSALPGGYSLAEGIRRQRTRGALRGSEAAGAAERLDRSARSMQELAGRVSGADGSPASPTRGYGSPTGVDREALAEAAAVERQLRELTGRVASLEQALRFAPEEAHPPLRELRADHITQLELGVAAYEQFVVAAAGYLSESARADGPVPSVAGLTDATERLRGVTAGLTELRTRYGDLPAHGG